VKLKSAAVAAKNARPLARPLVWVRKNVLENWHLKLLSLVVAFVLFAVSRQPSREIMLVNVPLEFINIATGLEISGEIPAAVNVRLRGPRDLVQGITANQLEVKADLSNKTAGERVVQLKPTDVIKPDKVEVRRIEPQTIELMLEPTRRKVVPIEAQFVGAVAEGYERLAVRLEPATVMIEGPESRVEQITKILTESVPLTERRTNFQMMVDLETGKQGVRIPNSLPIQLTVEIGTKKKPAEVDIPLRTP
jgi:YbbR domain-containing protein